MTAWIPMPCVRAWLKTFDQSMAYPPLAASEDALRSDHEDHDQYGQGAHVSSTPTG